MTRTRTVPIPLNAAGPLITGIDRGERRGFKKLPAESKRDVLYVPEFARVTRRILFIPILLIFLSHAECNIRQQIRLLTKPVETRFVSLSEIRENGEYSILSTNVDSY